MNYLSPELARGVWKRIAAALGRFPHGLYLADAYLSTEQRSKAMLAFGAMLSAFVRGRMHVHFARRKDAAQLMKKAGFKSSTLHETRGPGGDARSGENPRRRSRARVEAVR